MRERLHTSFGSFFVQRKEQRFPFSKGFLRNFCRKRYPDKQKFIQGILKGCVGFIQNGKVDLCDQRRADSRVGGDSVKVACERVKSRSVSRLPVFMRLSMGQQKGGYDGVLRFKQDGLSFLQV